MIDKFQKYLVDNGFKRETYEFSGKKCNWIENNSSMRVSTYGPLMFRLTKGDFYFYWGLGVAGKSPYYYYPAKEHYEIILSGNNENDMNELIEMKIETRLIA